MSIVWIWFAAGFIIDILTIYGSILGISSSYFGITVLALGNSYGDLLACIAISKWGFGSMAITGCFAGPLFDLMLGLAITTLKLVLEFGPFEFNIYCREGIYGLVGFSAVVILIILDITILPFTRYRYRNSFLTLRVVIYSGCIVVFTVFACFKSLN